MVIIPIIYYWHLADLLSASPIELEATQLASILVISIIAFEAFRLWRGFNVIGQREYERHQPSAFVWGSVSIGMVLITVPTSADGEPHAAFLGLPLIWSLSLIDPLLGELRRFGGSARVVAAAGVAATALIWAGSAFWLGTPWLLVPLMAPLTVASEWPRLNWIDDNATMTLIPLAVVLLLSPLIL
jgi:hypothetical protein